MTQPDAMEEVAFELAGAAIGSPAARGRSRRPRTHHGRMTEVLRYMAEHAAAPHKLAGLARMARMSPYHFLRSFKAATGVTPHQWLLRARLRDAAEQLATTQRAGDRYRARCRVRGPVEFHPHVPRRIRRLAAAISAGGAVMPPRIQKRNFLQVFARATPFRLSCLPSRRMETTMLNHVSIGVRDIATHQALLRRGAQAARLHVL